MSSPKEWGEVESFSLDSDMAWKMVIKWGETLANELAFGVELGPNSNSKKHQEKIKAHKIRELEITHHLEVLKMFIVCNLHQFPIYIE